MLNVLYVPDCPLLVLHKQQEHRGVFLFVLSPFVDEVNLCGRPYASDCFNETRKLVEALLAIGVEVVFALYPFIYKHKPFFLFSRALRPQPCTC